MKTTFAFSVAVCTAAAAASGPIDDQLGLGWASRRDMTSSEASAHYFDYRTQGYMLIDLDIDPSTSSGYSMVWQQNTTGRDWVASWNLTDSGYSTWWTYYNNAGYRPNDVECYLTSSGMRYAGIWVKNTEGLAWYSYRNLTSSQFSTTFSDLSGRGYRIVDTEAYQTSSGLRYACIWVENRDSVAWAHWSNMSSSSFATKRAYYTGLGYRLIDVESCLNSGSQVYAGIWEYDPDRDFAVCLDRSESQHWNNWNQMYDRGYRLIDFERYTMASGTRYATVWAENNTRYRWALKDEVDDLVEAYRTAKGIPGVSVAIVDNGTVVYRRGFGSAGSGRDAHGGTVYLAASISKVIGGTLAAKLEDEGRLWDGTSVSLDLTKATRQYLTSMPAAHSHTVEQLLSHTACMWHYTTGPEPPVRYYATALDAADEIWTTSPLSGCDPGTIKNYSTHAFTFVGAVLEDVTGRPVAELVREEIADRYGFSSMRAQFETSTLPSNEDRTTPYNSSGVATAYDDSSWKVLGGGIECSPADLAWFGWKVYNGDIVGAATRDDRLWTPVSSATTYGIGWALDTQHGHRTAGHSGDGTGASTRLRIYRDEGLVIAIMANREEVDTDSLADDIGKAILDP